MSINKTTLKNNIDEVIRLFQILKDCKETNKQSNTNNDLGIDIENMNRISENCSEESNKLNSYLESLSDIELVEILAVMYAGREKYIQNDNFEDDLDKQIDSFKGHPREGCLASITEKVPLIEYLTAGIQLYHL